MRYFLLSLFYLSALLVQAGTIDSLYLSVRNDVKGNLSGVNELIAQLDAHGWADTLITYTHHDKRERIEATLSLYMAYRSYDLGMFASSEELIRQTIMLSYKLDDKLLRSDAMSHLSATLFRAGKIDDALECTIDVLHLDSLLGDKERLSSSYNNLAALNLAAHHYQQAERYILRAIQLEEALDNPRKLPVRYGIASEVYTAMQRYDSALGYISKAYKIERDGDNVVGASRRQSQMADVYLAKGEYNEAERLYKTAIETLRQEGEMSSLVISLKQLGKLYIEKQEWDKCIKVLEESDSLLRKSGNKYQLMQHSKVMAEAFKHKGCWQQASTYFEEALQLHEDVMTEQLNTLTTDYNTRQQWLGQESEDISTGRWWHGTALIIILLLLAVIVFLSYRLYRVTRATVSNSEGETPQDSPTVEAEIAEESPAESCGGQASLAPRPRLAILSPEDDEFLFRFQRIVRDNLGKVDVEMIMKKLEISNDSLALFTNRTCGMTPKTLIQYYKMEHATRLLLTTNRTINDIAMECGYYDNSHFGRVFTRFYNVSPGVYRKNGGGC